MSLPNRISAYDDCFRCFADAVPDGARFLFADHGQAHYFMMRCHNARALQREESKRLYDKTDRRWGKSEYDSLMVRTPTQDTDGHWWIYIEPHEAQILKVEKLEPGATLRNLQLNAATAALQLEGPDNDSADNPGLTIEGTLNPSE